MKGYVLKLNKIAIMVLALVIVIFAKYNYVYADATTAGQQMRNQVIFLADIADENNLDGFITRGEFARMVVKTSPYKDTISDIADSAAFSDVAITDPYASYIKIAAKYGYMVSYLGGLFKPNDFVTMRDVARACLALLGYENSDFAGNQTFGRILKFNELELNKNINKNQLEFLTKTDCINAIYNTLRENKKGSNEIYGTIFKLTLDSSKELNANEMIRTTLTGPIIAKRKHSVNEYLPFDFTAGNYFLNGFASTYNQLVDELNTYGYLVLYLNEPTNTVYAYRNGVSKDSTVFVTRGYVENIYYDQSNNLTPNAVEIDESRYTFGNAEVKFAFSFAGSIKIGDEVIIIVESISTSGSDDVVASSGNITSAFLYTDTIHIN